MRTLDRLTDRLFGATTASLVAVALLGLLFPPSVLAEAKPTRASSLALTELSQDLLRQALTAAPEMFWVDIPSQARQLLFVKAGNGYLFSDPHDSANYGYTDLDDLAGLTDLALDGAAGVGRGSVPLKSGAGPSEAVHFEITSNGIDSFLVDLGQGTDKSRWSRFEIHVPNLGLPTGEDGEKAVIVIVTISIWTIIVAGLTCGALLQVCQDNCATSCPIGYDYVGVDAVLCGIWECRCKCERRQSPGSGGGGLPTTSGSEDDECAADSSGFCDPSCNQCH